MQQPLARHVLDSAALDLDHGDAHTRPHDDGIGLAITPVVGQPQLRQHHRAVRKLLAQREHATGSTGGEHSTFL